MPYFLVENFRFGIDTRKHVLAAPAGTLRTLVNAHVTPGGEIEKRKAFVALYEDLGDASKVQLGRTFGLAERANVLTVFQDAAVSNGSDPEDWDVAARTVSTPYGDLFLTRELLTGSDFQNGVPGAVPLDRLLDWDIFEGSFYVIAQGGEDGAPQHFFNGARVTDANAVGDSIRVFKNKVYSVDDDGIHFCAVGDPTDWTTTADGAGFISTAGATSEGERLNGIEVYYDWLAVFSETGVQLWDMDADPANNTLRQVIASNGLVAPATPKQFGSGDIMFLSASGIRSLLARDSSNAGSVSDVGAPIDPEIQNLLRTDFDTYAVRARTAIEETTGRVWVSFGDQIWVLSQFPGERITAWSKYIPERLSGAFTVSEMVQAFGMMCLRGTDNTIYLYGGADDATYDETEASFTMPYLSFDNPAALKQIWGIDVACSGSWDVDYSPDPRSQQWTPAARIYSSTFLEGRIGVQAYTAAMSLRFRSTEPERGVIAQALIHYDLARAD